MQENNGAASRTGNESRAFKYHELFFSLADPKSLLHLQVNHVDSEIAISKLKDNQSYILGMGFDHEHPYQRSYLSLDRYIRNLSNKIHSTFKDPEKDIRLSFNLDQVKVTPGQATTCGQLISEIMTNAFKHAFPKKERGIIEIILKEENGHIKLEISDNGKGIPDEAIQKKKPSLGLNLIHNLSKQLKGETDIRNENGTTYLSVFPKKFGNKSPK